MKKSILLFVLFFSCQSTKIKINSDDCYSIEELKTLVPTLSKKIKENKNFNHKEKILLIKTYNTSCFNHLFKDEQLDNYLWDFFLLFDNVKYKLIEDFDFEYEFSSYYSSKLNMRIGVVNNYDENCYLKIKDNNCVFYFFDKK